MTRLEETKVFVGMSGGVDSSVAAYLLTKQGYTVTGIHLRCWNRGGCDEREARDARIVADQIGIPFYVLDLEKEYKQKVVDYMIDGYKDGSTPNPDVMCNREIKFGLFMEKALAMGADYVATGHYARVKEERGGYTLYAGLDENKDQSYFLWTLGQAQLAHTMFPVGDMTKPQVRRVAKEAGLHVADKKDSQGVCFIGQITLQDFLGEYLGEKRGEVLNTAGEVVGTHNGTHLYTIGQRHGLGVALSTPHYVAAKDTKKNLVVLAKREEDVFAKREIALSELNLVTEAELPDTVYARVRYRQPLQAARLIVGVGGKGTLSFAEPVNFVAPGQSAVFYNSEGQLLGGGVIE